MDGRPSERGGHASASEGGEDAPLDEGDPGPPPPAMPRPPQMPSATSVAPAGGSAWIPPPPPPAVSGRTAAGESPEVAAEPPGDAQRPPAESGPAGDAMSGEGSAEAPRMPTFGPREVADDAGPFPPDDGSGAPAAAPTGAGDWLATICPYLASADGTYRSATADDGNRCTAQDPPATLPLAFQERYCLTDRHTRCEMYKFAREAGTPEGVPTETVAAVGTRPLRAARSARNADGVDRRLVAGAAGLGGVIVLVVVLVLLMGSCSSQPPGTGGEGSPDPAAASVEPADDSPTEAPTPSDTDAGPEPDGTPDPSAAVSGNELIIRYEVQEGEALLAIAETFDITRRRLWRMNEGLEAIAPAELPGQVILVPVPPTMTLADLEEMPGYLGPADEA